MRTYQPFFWFVLFLPLLHNPNHCKGRWGYLRGLVHVFAPFVDVRLYGLQYFIPATTNTMNNKRATRPSTL